MNTGRIKKKLGITKNRNLAKKFANLFLKKNNYKSSY